MPRRSAIALLALLTAPGCWGPNTTYVTPPDYQEVLGRGAPAVTVGLSTQDTEWSAWHDRLEAALRQQANLLRVDPGAPSDSPKRVDIVMDVRIEEKEGARAARSGGPALDAVLTIGTLGVYALLGGSTTRVDRNVAIDVRYWYAGQTFRTYRDHVHVDGAVNIFYASADEHHRTLERIVNESILYDLLARAVPLWTGR